MKQTIEHTGTIEKLDNGHVVVRILQASACSSCAAAQLCRSSESKEKFIDVYTDDTTGLQVGTTVLLSGTAQQSLQAVLWAYVMPLILLVMVLAVVSTVTGSEGWAALASLLILIPYYFVLYMMRNRISRKLSFKIINFKN